MIEIKLKDNVGQILIDGVDISKWVTRIEVVSDASEYKLGVVIHLFPEHLVLDMAGEADISYKVIDWPDQSETIPGAAGKE